MATTEFIWHVPTAGDAVYGDAGVRRRGERSSKPFNPGVSDPRGNTFNFFDHIHQVVRAAELAGFDGVHIPHDPAGDDAWIVAGSVARGTRRIKLLTEFDSAWGSAVYAAKNAASFQRFSGGRFAWFIRAGATAEERLRHADGLGSGDEHTRLREFVHVARGVLSQAPFDFKGQFFEVKDGGFRDTLANLPLPQVYLSGTRDEDLALSAEIADVQVLPALPVSEIEDKASSLHRRAQATGRQVRVAVRLDLVARESESEAVRDVKGRRDDRLVGSYEQIAEQLVALENAGVSSFILSAAPHLEEAYRIGTHVLPVFRRKAELAHAPAPDQRAPITHSRSFT